MTWTKFSCAPPAAVSPGSSPRAPRVAGSEAALRLAAQRPGTVWATVGIHPHHAAEFSPQASRHLHEMLGDPRAVAVGECGLDYCRNYAPSGDQRLAFEGQLKIAADCGKPVFLHQRDAHDEFLRMLRDYWPSLAGGVAHCFTGRPARDSMSISLSVCTSASPAGSVMSDVVQTCVQRSPRLPLDRAAA